MRTKWVGDIERAESEKEKEKYQGKHREELTKLAAYIACIQHAPHMPGVSKTDLSPVIQSSRLDDIEYKIQAELTQVCEAQTVDIH